MAAGARIVMVADWVVTKVEVDVVVAETKVDTVTKVVASAGTI